MTETPPPADVVDELDRALWRAVYDWAVARARWAAARAAADPAAPADREPWDAVVLLGVLGGCRNAGVTYDEVELTLWRLAHAREGHRDFAELRELTRRRRPKVASAPPPAIAAGIAGNFAAAYAATHPTTSAGQAEAHVTETETSTNGGTE
jgi:hypothetical protein